MTKEEAAKINSDIVLNGAVTIGIYGKEVPSLAKYSLADMVEASHIMSDDGKVVVCDDRLIAALYVACNYSPDSKVPVAVANGNVVVVARARHNMARQGEVQS